MTSDPCEPAVVVGYIDNKDAQLRRLRRIEGQIRGPQRMVESQAYCIDIMTQVSAATKDLGRRWLWLAGGPPSSVPDRRHPDASVDKGGNLAAASAAVARLVRS